MTENGHTTCDSKLIANKFDELFASAPASIINEINCCPKPLATKDDNIAIFGLTESTVCIVGENSM